MPCEISSSFFQTLLPISESLTSPHGALAQQISLQRGVYSARLPPREALMGSSWLLCSSRAEPLSEILMAGERLK
ncbi:uncharacterized [Tachysurus ichikawai]